MRTRKIKNKCYIEMIRVKEGLLMKCKNLKRTPTAQEILDEIKDYKVKWKD